MNPQVAGITDVGALRTANQDAIDWRVSEDNRQVLLVVADGMGGYHGGEVASRIAVDTVMEVLVPWLSPDEGCRRSRTMPYSLRSTWPVSELLIEGLPMRTWPKWGPRWSWPG